MGGRGHAGLAGAVLIALLTVGVAAPPARGAVRGAAWILLHAETGDVLSESHADDRLPPASLAKMLTALVARERAGLEEPVKISEAASAAREDRLRWPNGFTFSVEQMLYGLLLESSNGAGIALAEHIAGSERAFAGLMNAKARSLGALRSNFVTPHGLDAPGQVSTARDLAAISRALLADDVLSRIVHTGSYRVSWLGGQATFHNSTKFLAMYQGSIGIKPGFTSVAGNCLAAAARRAGNTLIAVVLNSVTVTEDAVALMDAAFPKLPARRIKAETEAAPIVLGSRLEAKDDGGLEPVAFAAPDVPLAAGGPVRPPDSHVPSIPGTALVFTVTFVVAKRRARERELARSRA